MARRSLIVAVFVLVTVADNGLAHTGRFDLDMFGYFQVALRHQESLTGDRRDNSFGVQQLNLFLQKDIARRWTAFVNFEVVNNFSSSRGWGSFNLEEAWVRWRVSRQLNLKLGLHIPEFNNLNVIKNRTPLLPYIIRPHVYEASLENIVNLEEFLPARAFVQTYGFIPTGLLKLDYAVFVGNSPNITNRSDHPIGAAPRVTGTDTTDTFLFGGRVGVRAQELKAGFSFTHDKSNIFQIIAEDLRVDPSKLEEKTRIRIGGDFSYHLRRFQLESEYIRVDYNDEQPDVDLHREFYYATLGYQATDEFLGYVSFWRSDETFSFARQGPLTSERSEVDVMTAGASFLLHERINMKLQHAFVETNETSRGSGRLSLFSGAISVFF